MKLTNLNKGRYSESGFTLGMPVAILRRLMPSKKFEPREEVIRYFEQSLKSGAEKAERPYSPRLVDEIRRGTPIGRELYSTMEIFYENSLRDRKW